MGLRLLRFAPAHTAAATLHTRRLLLRAPQMDDHAAWADLRLGSRAHLEPFEPLWAEDELSRTAWRSRMRHQQADMVAGRTVPFLLFEAESGALVGGAALGNIRRAIAQTATLGYWIGQPFAGRHFMREAVQAIAAHAFADVAAGGLGLLRLEAATVPENEASQKVLAACGFSREGTARGYLEIGGRRRDHHLFARLSGDGC